MQFRIKSLLLATLVPASLMLGSTSALAEEGKKVKLDEIAWLAGCWKAKVGEARADNYEQWMKPIGNVMLGLGVELKAGKATSYEYMRIEANDKGDLVYTVKPHGKSETPFTLTSTTAKTLVFENPKNDFPQKITYKLEKDGSMEMRIDGQVGEKRLASLYPVVKMSCE